MINTECVSHMESGGATMNDRRTLERVKNITLTENNSFRSMNV